jgi:hypothetical protein
MGTKLAWGNSPDEITGTWDKNSSPGRPAPKSRPKTGKNNRSAAKSNGRNPLRASKPAAKKQQKKPVAHGRTTSRQSGNRRAAMMIDESGNLFLNP